jgi:hypothetical protein
LCRARKKVDTVLNENIDIEYSEADGHDDNIEVIVGRHGDSVAAMGKINKHSPAADWPSMARKSNLNWIQAPNAT